MHQPPEPAATEINRAHELQPYEVVYLAKRPAYEFSLALPKTPPPPTGGKQAFFRVHFRRQRQGREVVLEWNELGDFYESLGQLMEYVQIERRKHPGTY
jgi:hypothetical protein